jgi:hypothetical protein
VIDKIPEGRFVERLIEEARRIAEEKAVSGVED